MARRLLPTGVCWCGCKTEVDLGSFFAPGHDKKAEARLFMEVFGGVPQFLEAFGYGPEGNDAASTDSWVFWAAKLARVQKRQSTTRFKIEYADIDRLAPLKRSTEATLEGEVDLAEGASSFRMGNSTFTLPFVDIVDIHKEGGFEIVRVSGTLKASDGQFGVAWAYVARGQDERAVNPGMSAGFREFVSALRKNHSEVTLTVLEGIERRVYTGELAYNIGDGGENQGMVFMRLRPRGTVMPIPKGIITGWTRQIGDLDCHQQLVRSGYIDGNITR